MSKKKECVKKSLLGVARHTDHKLKLIKFGNPMVYQCVRCGKIVKSKEE